MKNTFGQHITLTLFGESHGPAVGFVLDGLTPGTTVDENEIRRQLARRRPVSGLDTPRQEKDEFRILSGVWNGRATGTPLTLVIGNADTRSQDYTYGPARPSHADYTAHCKYHGFEDYRGGGHFSGRVTAALAAAGGILLPLLQSVGISIGTHILQCGQAFDRPFEALPEDLALLSARDFPVLDDGAREAITAEIEAARAAQDSVGGQTQTAVCGLPAGVGEPWFDSVEGLLSHALFSLGGVKGVSFGAGFDVCGMRGSRCNDPLRMREGKIVSATNHNGGVNGGITNGAPVVFQCAVKPTPSIARPQETVDFVKMENTSLTVRGRHDPAIIRRICPVIDSVTALAVCDLLAGRYGTDFPSHADFKENQK